MKQLSFTVLILDQMTGLFIICTMASNLKKSVKMNIINLHQSKSEMMFRLVELAQAKGRDITIGSNDPALRYEQLRKRFPNAIMVLEEWQVRIVGKRNG